MHGNLLLGILKVVASPCTPFLFVLGGGGNHCDPFFSRDFCSYYGRFCVTNIIVYSFVFFLFLLIFSVLFVSKEVIKMMRTLLNEAQTGGLFVYFRGPPT